MPAMLPIKKIEICARRYEHTIKLVAVLVAAIFALNQYFSHLQEERVKTTLEFYKRLSSSPLFEVRDVLNEKWETKWPVIQAKFSKPQTKEEMKNQLVQWKIEVIQFIVDNKLTVKTIELFDFYNALQLCVENDLCDKETATNLLKPSGIEFIQNNCPYIAYMRFNRKDKDFGEKAMKFTSGACNPEMYRQ